MMEFLSKLWANPQVRQIALIVVGIVIQWLTRVANQLEQVPNAVS